jgi:hypothetical protein
VGVLKFKNFIEKEVALNMSSSSIFILILSLIMDDDKIYAVG